MGTTARHAEASRDSLRHEVTGNQAVVSCSFLDNERPKLHGKEKVYGSIP